MKYLTNMISREYEQIKKEFLFYKDIISFGYNKDYGWKIGIKWLVCMNFL